MDKPPLQVCEQVPMFDVMPSVVKLKLVWKTWKEEQIEAQYT